MDDGIILHSEDSAKWISMVIPEGVVGMEIKDGDAVVTSLFPEEQQALGYAAETRRREFISGRTCAHATLRALGVTPVPVLRGSQREPIWPSGVVGSITHCHGYCAAVAASTLQYAAIGIDAEVHDRLPVEAISDVLLDKEKAWVQSRCEEDTHWDRMIFSAKESTYKAWFALTHLWLGFEDVTVTVRPEGRVFRSRLIRPALILQHNPIAELQGRYAFAGGLILTAAWVRYGSQSA
jgi:4'-phosphopantetheinyl transferase EntD